MSKLEFMGLANVAWLSAYTALLLVRRRLRLRVREPQGPFKRDYEWRYLDTGGVRSVESSTDACALFLNSHATESVKPAGSARPGRPVGIFVKATGERVEIEAAQMERGRARLDKDMPWFNRDGKSIT